MAVGLPEGNLIIDTSPEMRLQLTREKIGRIHAALFTHEHADHLFGLDDLRVFPHDNGAPLPIYCEEFVEERIRASFSYAFTDRAMALPAGYVPQLVFARVTLEPFDLLGQRFIPVRLHHGRYEVMGYRIGDLAYCTDVQHIPEETFAKLQGLEVFILDCLRVDPHPSHMHLELAIETAKRVGAKRTYFTHMSCKLDHAATSAVLPDGMELAYDGLRLPLPIPKLVV
ncbi:MAG TPA: MBL fold metallo-hydrolase [Pirellulales bacterium]